MKVWAFEHTYCVYEEPPHVVSLHFKRSDAIAAMEKHEEQQRREEAVLMECDPKDTCEFERWRVKDYIVK